MTDQSLHPPIVNLALMPAMAPPADVRPGPVTWIKRNLFSTPFSAALTICFVLLAVWLLHQFLSFAILKAVWSGGREACSANPEGACWPFIAEKFDYLRYGAYPISERWRVDLTQAIGTILIVWLLWTKAPRRKLAAMLFFVFYPIAAFVLLRGVALLHLPVIDTTLWGGLLITLLMSSEMTKTP
jgi:general L-amino acid transport system permease protein